MGARVAVVAVLMAGAAHAVPTPSLRAPADGGWTRRQAALEAFVAPSIPAGVGTFDFEVDVVPGTSVYLAPAPVDRETSNSTVFHTTGPGLPDAGLLYWRARAVDDAGTPSGWSPFETFRIDDQAPALPAQVLVSLDGGDAWASWPAIVDAQSGVKEYHVLIGQRDAPDAAFLPNFDTRYLPTATGQRVRLGPGRWRVGVHAHDEVMNTGAGSTPSDELVVPVSGAVAIPEAPRLVRFDGGALPTAPYTRFTPVRLAWGPDAGAASVGYAVIARTAEQPWVHVAEADGTLAFAELDEGRYEVRVAALEPGAVSDYSGPSAVVVDTTSPFTPAPTAQRDGGQVTIRWPSVRDRAGAAGSGVLEYRVERCCPTAVLATVADVPDASISTVDTLGAGDWRWDVRAVDRAGNVGNAGSAFLGDPPPTPAPPDASPAVTRLPVVLAWAALDAGAPVTWNLFRRAPAGTSVAIGVGLTGLTATDPAPEGRWRYTVQAIARGQTGPVSAPSQEVLVDTTAPGVGPVGALRTAAREVRVSWTATDALSGVGAAQLFRETNGVEQALGSANPPAADLPPDGTHRYRVEATDLAGNVAASGWSAPVVTPGTTLAIAPVEGQIASCGKETVVNLEAKGEPATQWSLVGGSTEAVAIDASSGRLTFTPTKTTPSPQIVTVRAESETSLAERPISFSVTCAPATLAVGCGCSSVEVPIALAALVLFGRRRKPRVPP